jgi:hypothetical protein
MEAARPAFLGFRYCPASLFAMMDCYFDESGGKDNGFTAVCGWIASAEQWDRFDTDWRLFLAHYDVPYFHMRLFAHFKNPFEKFENDKSKRSQFLSDAAGIIRSTARRGFLFEVDHRSFDAADEHYKLSEAFSTPYALAGRCCVDAASTWRERDIGEPLDAHYIFEDGGPDKGGLLRAMTRIIPHRPTPIFEPSIDHKPSRKWPNGRKGLLQLQAADFIAYETGKAKRDRMMGRTKVFRKSLEQLFKVEMSFAVPTQQDIEKFCQQAKIGRR